MFVLNGLLQPLPEALALVCLIIEQRPQELALTFPLCGSAYHNAMDSLAYARMPPEFVNSQRENAPAYMPLR